MQSLIYWQVVGIIEVRMVTNEPNLKEIERRAYTSYHQDGLLDIFVGAYVLGLGLGVYMDVIWEYGFAAIMPAILMATALPIWIAAKRRITVPRIGFVNFGIRGKNKLTAILIGTMVAGLFAFFAFTLVTSQSGMRQWVDLVFQNGMVILGLGSLAVCFIFGYSMGLRRLYTYGILASIALAIGHFVDRSIISFAYILTALGTMVIVSGIALLIRFVKKYPLKGDKTIAK
jgi:hypothetical protein